jgi:hypothetical protein
MEMLTLWAVSTRLRCSLVNMSLAVGISEVIVNVIFEVGFLGKGLIERRSYTLRIHMYKCKAGNRKGDPWDSTIKAQKINDWSLPRRLGRTRRPIPIQVWGIVACGKLPALSVQPARVRVCAVLVHNSTNPISRKTKLRLAPSNACGSSVPGNIEAFKAFVARTPGNEHR